MAKDVVAKLGLSTAGAREWVAAKRIGRWAQDVVLAPRRAIGVTNWLACVVGSVSWFFRCLPGARA